MNENETKETGSKLYAWLVKLGVPAVLAAAIVGAVYAALVALGVLSLPGCTVTLDVLPDGAQHFDGTLVLPQTVTPTK